MEIKPILEMVQVLSVVAGVAISVVSLNATRQKDFEARQAEAARPFFEQRQKLYMEALKAAAVLANDEGYTDKEKAVALRRFRELYVAELSMVESPEVEKQMVGLAEKSIRA